ncbi:hypothetical protein [Arthrobacter sp. M4]|uniref:hypothetical protein n=1 Tax=Arthrobacter sp. M4 TaxID=218160 RepID=UPI001CDC8B38|nr:hypothetical protein [Arthrobacter sp. M4]MCA4133931.1 hypothetical protein [Arthrobacter sp. M4]
MGGKMRRQKKTWKDMTQGQRIATIVIGSIQIALFAAAQRSISKTPASRIRGSKAMWRAASFINTLGPLSYFVFGRRRETV